MPHTDLDGSVADPGLLLSVSTVTDRRPGRVIVVVVGEVDEYSAPALDVCLQSQARQPGVRELVVDLVRVTFPRRRRDRRAGEGGPLRSETRRPARGSHRWPARGAPPGVAGRSSSGGVDPDERETETRSPGVRSTMWLPSFGKEREDTP